MVAPWTDEALHTGEHDTLERLPYARRAADLIHMTHSFESSAVFGLSGPWGSGKTSLVNMIVEELQREHSGWAVARFNPWATSDVSGLLAEFHTSLIEVLPKRKRRRLRKALAAVASVAVPAAHMVPVAGAMAAEGARLAAKALAKSPSWQTAFKDASKELKNVQRPILVVVDDIDRLHGEELSILLKVVRLLGRFDGVQYLLAYDDETLHRSIASSNIVSPHNGSAERFMEKIVQYSFFVPPLSRHQQISRLNAGLESVSRRTVEADGGRLSGMVDCFTDLLTTPRAIDRYIAQLQHHIPLLPTDEVDDEDVQLLTLIRVCFPNLFNSIPRHRSELVTGHTDETRVDVKSFEYEPFDIEPLLEVVPAEDRSSARKLLVSLFPKTRQKNQLWVHESRRRQSIQYEEYFDRYFAMGILKHDVSDTAVEAAVKSAIAGEAFSLTKLLLGTEESIRGLVLSKCLNPENQPDSDKDRLNLANGVARIVNDFPSSDRAPFSDQDQLLSWIVELILGLDKRTLACAVQAPIWEIRDVRLRIRTWTRLSTKINHTNHTDKPSWYDKIADALVNDAACDFLHHLLQDDDAEMRFGIGYQVHFVLGHRPELLRTAVNEQLQSGRTNLPTLASRLVETQTIVGSKMERQLSPDFDQYAFDQLAPPRDDPWYYAPVQEVDVNDLSWANRRKFAAGRVDRPPAGRFAEPESSETNGS